MAGAQAEIGVIGGSNFYDMQELTSPEVVAAGDLDIPKEFGIPSGDFVIGQLEGVPVAFLPRHGVGHTLTPTEVPNQANIFGFKLLGVERVVSVSSVGSLRETIEPLHLVVPDQAIDSTTKRESTFFGNGIVAHVSFADPFCLDLNKQVVGAARQAGATVHDGGTYVCMEGLPFSTRAESERNRETSGTIIGMTAVPEAKLAREASMCYSLLALSTDYDSWHETEAAVTGQMVLENSRRNVRLARQTLVHLIPNLAQLERECGCATALEGAIFTSPDKIPADVRTKLQPIIGRYIGSES